MLKTVRFTTVENNSSAVAYQVFQGHICVFTGIEPAHEGSTINYAEVIALTIANAERVGVGSLRYFDLQTRVSYGPGMGKSEPGSFEFEEVELKPSSSKPGGIQATRWLLAKCPTYVIKAFWPYLDGEPRQIVRGAFETEL